MLRKDYEGDDSEAQMTNIFFCQVILDFLCKAHLILFLLHIMLKMEVTENLMKKVMQSQQILVKLILTYMRQVDVIHLCHPDGVLYLKLSFSKLKFAKLHVNSVKTNT